jgi:hypothetical protein
LTAKATGVEIGGEWVKMVMMKGKRAPPQQLCSFQPASRMSKDHSTTTGH